MKNLTTIVFTSLAALLVLGTLAIAADEENGATENGTSVAEATEVGSTVSGPTVSVPTGGGVQFSGAFGVGLTVIGAGYGIGRLAGCALESMARQPEVAGNIQTAMIIAAALIEGFTFYALFICSGQNPFAAG